MERRNILEMWNVSKPIIGMIHLKGDSALSRFERAIAEINMMIECGIDAVLIENYFGGVEDVEKVLKYINKNPIFIPYGVNVLGNPRKAFELSTYGANFIQIDSVVGHLPPDQDELFGEVINALRTTTDAALIGGVRFKYQPYLSGRDLEEDLKIAMDRCDGIVVTGAGTGLETDLEKIRQFRQVISDFPLIVGAGLNLKNLESQLDIADAGIVGSYLKEDHYDHGDLSYENTSTFMGKVRSLRK